MANPIDKLIDKPAEEVYRRLFNIRHVPLKKKIKIIEACLSDKKNLDLNDHDPNYRSYLLKIASESLELAIIKNEMNKTSR